MTTMTEYPAISPWKVAQEWEYMTDDEKQILFDTVERDLELPQPFDLKLSYPEWNGVVLLTVLAGDGKRRVYYLTPQCQLVPEALWWISRAADFYDCDPRDFMAV